MAGLLRLPDNFNLSDNYPAIVVTGPMLSVKEQAQSVYAERLTEAGYVTLVFDGTYFGESEGTPRGQELPEVKQSDIEGAVDFLCSLPFVDNNRTAMVNMFDNMIQHGLCKPFIAVSPTWDKDNRPKDWGKSCREAAVFANEYVNDLIPAVESHYSTYCETTDEAGILAFRGHRALGGFSLGSITTWYVFEQAFPYSRWYLPMSGDNWSQGMFGGQYHPEATVQFLADLVNASPYGNDFYVWYAVGTDDVRKPQTHNQAMAMAALTETFNASTFSYHQKQGGQHDFNAVWEFCYNALPFFFPKDK